MQNKILLTGALALALSFKLAYALRPWERLKLRFLNVVLEILYNLKI